MASDPQTAAHRDWLGLVQPTGLVVSAPALAAAGAVLNRDDRDGQARLRACVEEHPLTASGDPEPLITDFTRFARQVLGWSMSEKGYSAGASFGDSAGPPELELPLPEYGLTLRPDIAVRERDPADGGSAWQLLVRVLPPGVELDSVSDGDKLEASEHSRMERLLRRTGVPAGLLCNGRTLRLISAPRGESSGWLDFPVAAMVQTAGRPIVAALRLLLSEQRLLALPKKERLAALLRRSREYQNDVSEKLAGQVLEALYELLRGFQAAQDLSAGFLLARPLAEHPDEIYQALLSVILRLVFLLYAEERGMLPDDDTFVRFYSLAGLYRRLRDDDARHADTMGQRYGAWAQLLALFRIVHDGAGVGAAHMPPRHGALFDPDRYPFLEGRPAQTARQTHERIEPPAVPDGTVHRVLEKLLVLDGERISYRALDVEQIGSVYETMMGFSLRRATGRSIAIRSGKPFGAPSTIDLDALAAVVSEKRSKWIDEVTGRKLTAKQAAAVKAAGGVPALHAALAPVIDTAATPDLVSREAMVLQPSAERRRSGSHYTPRSLTEPIVRTTLTPVLDALRSDGHPLTPQQLLDLKVCDPAMGSAAFLVEACRQLADELVAAWAAHGGRPELPADEDELTFARRMIAQRCLYGVDRNPVAVDLGKMSLWLATLAREHPLTFLDHALRHGDSLVGLTRRQIESFDWKPGAPSFASIRIGTYLERVGQLRREIREAADGTSDRVLRDMWDEAQAELAQVRVYGDLTISAFFAGDRPKAREAKRIELADAVTNGTATDMYGGWLAELREAEKPLVPFHWPIEFPEVFDRDRPGFDAIVGNPPFAGKNTLGDGNIGRYPDWLKESHPGSHGNADLVAHFFRRGFDLLRPDGALGLIATNTIGQGDTRATGLRWICTHGGEIYAARKRVKWPGRSAAVVVSVVHIVRGKFNGPRLLDGREAPIITAYLFHAGGHDDPARLAANAGRSFIGSYVLGIGFTFDDADTKGVANTLAEMERLKVVDPANEEVIFPYIGGQEINESSTHAHRRYVINFGERSERDCRKGWPELMAIIEERVKPEREAQNDAGAKAKWWQFIRPRPELQAATADLDRVLVTSSVSAYRAFAFVAARLVISHNVTVVATQSDAAFATLSSRAHEVWATFFSSSLEDRSGYRPSDCFETFPFPREWDSSDILEVAGAGYYEHRARMMVENDEGLTKTYNRFHHADEKDPGIVTLRALHAEVDRAVLHAYGWDDISTECDFFTDYEGAKQRYRWPDDVRDEVLARLIALNAERAAEEQRSGAAATDRRARAASVGGARALNPLAPTTEALF
jgi:hypothetical protein